MDYKLPLSNETIKKIGVGIGAVFVLIGMITLFAFNGNWFIFISGASTIMSGLLHLYNNLMRK